MKRNKRKDDFVDDGRVVAPMSSVSEARPSLGRSFGWIGFRKPKLPAGQPNPEEEAPSAPSEPIVLTKGEQRAMRRAIVKTVLGFVALFFVFWVVVLLFIQFVWFHLW